MTNEPKKTGESVNPNDIEYLIVGHFDGTLSEEQERELAGALTTSAEAKQLFLSYMRMEGRLHSLGRDGLLREPTAEASAMVSQPADSVPEVQSRRRSWRSRVLAASTSLAVCAVVMLAWTLWPSSVSADSVLKKAQQAAAEMVDRTYRVVMSNANADGPRSHEVAITVRGGGRFVVQPDNGAFVMGSDGNEYWMAIRDGPVFVSGDFRNLARELPQRISNRRLVNRLDRVLVSPDAPLLLDMSRLLLLIEHRYDIAIVESADPGEHVRAIRRADVRSGPSTIDLQVDAQSGVVLKAELSFVDDRRRILELIETPTLSDEWYHFSEHAPDRPVKRVVADSP